MLKVILFCFFSTLVIKYFVAAALSDGFPDGEEIASHIISIVIQAITIVVVAVPEGVSNQYHLI
jgi:Ca2+-transporting ATPase